MDFLSPWPAFFCAIDFQGHLQQVNTAWQQWGLQEQVLLTTTLTHWLHPDDVATTQDSIAQLWTQKAQQVCFENRWRDHHGTYHWLLWSARLTDQLVYAVGLAFETQKQQYIQQQQQLVYYQAVVEQLPQGIIVYDPEGNIQLCNPSAARLLRTQASQLVGKTQWPQRLKDETGAELTAERHPAVITAHTAKAQHTRLALLQADYPKLWLNINTMPLLTSTTLPCAVVCTLSDITEERQQQKALSHEVKLLTTLFEQAPLSIAVIDDEGHFVYVNQNFGNSHGYRAQELVHQPFTLLLPPSARKQAWQRHADFMAGRVDNSGSWPLQHQAGHVLNSQIIALKINIQRGFKVIYILATQEKNIQNLNVELIYQQSLQLLLAQLPLTLLSLNQHGQVTLAQGRHIEQLELTHALGKSLEQINPRLAELARAYQSTWESKTLSYAGIRFQTHGAPLVENNNPIGILLVFDDISEQQHLKIRLMDTLQELALLLPHTTIAALTTAGETIIRMTPPATQLLGYEPQELRAAKLAKLFKSRKHYLQFQQHIQSQQTHYHQSLLGKAGHQLDCQLTLHTLKSKTKKLWFLEAAQAPPAAQFDLAFHTLLWNTTDETFFILDHQLRIQQANPASQKLTGYHTAELIGKTLLDLSPDKTNDYTYQKIQAGLSEASSWSGEIWQRHKNNSIYQCMLKLQPYEDHRYLARLNALQTYQTTLFDPLTQLPNLTLFRYSLQRNLAIAKRKSKRFSIFLINIEQLAQINAQYGCRLGDQFLQTLGQGLKETVRESDTVARYSGDTFGINLDEIAKPQDANLVAQMVLFKLSQPLIIEAQQLHSAVSIGIVVFPEDGHDVDILLELAQAALRRAQEQGGNQCCFHNPQLQNT
ncbi:MAG: GGDEF domain-containing protein [Pseudomonadota bacterium]|nr:GGDEF domain-containing protein [Pseudomonadota bacterium]